MAGRERRVSLGERDAVRAAYNYAEHLPERRRMMQAWSDFLQKLFAVRTFASIGSKKSEVCHTTAPLDEPPIGGIPSQAFERQHFTEDCMVADR